MNVLKFKNVETASVGKIRDVFDVIALGKRAGSIDEDKLASILDDRISFHFITTKAESDEWLAKWKADSSIVMPWDFGSWVDAFMNADIELEKIEVDLDGSGSIHFDQLSWPSGGIDAIEEIVRIFKGVIVSNDAT